MYLVLSNQSAQRNHQTMQSKKDSSHPIPEIIVIDDEKAFPSRAITNRRRPSRKRLSSRQLGSKRESFSLHDSTPSGTAAQQSTRHIDDQPFTEEAETEKTYVDRVITLPPDEEDGSQRPVRMPRRRITRRASIDLGMLPSHDDLALNQRPVRRKSTDHITPTVLPWSYDHNTDSSDDDASISCFVDPGEVVFVGVTEMSNRELMDAMFCATSASLDMSMSHSRLTSSANECRSPKPMFEPLLSLADLCSTLMPPRVVADNASNDHISNGLPRQPPALKNSLPSAIAMDSLVSAISMDNRSAPELSSLKPNDST